jgi:hypothetical protein
MDRKKYEKPVLRQVWVVAAALSTLAGCASPVQMLPTSLITSAEGGQQRRLSLSAQASSSAGFVRTLPAGTVLVAVGRVAAGDVWRPVNHVLTVEGRHIHEAYVVVRGGQWVGFYLPVERTFSPLSSPITLSLEPMQ